MLDLEPRRAQRHATDNAMVLNALNSVQAWITATGEKPSLVSLRAKFKSMLDYLAGGKGRVLTVSQRKVVAKWIDPNDQGMVLERNVYENRKAVVPVVLRAPLPKRPPGR